MHSTPQNIGRQDVSLSYLKIAVFNEIPGACANHPLPVSAEDLRTARHLLQTQAP